MCGIAGVIGENANPEQFSENEVLTLLGRRGPDARKAVRCRAGYFFHARLSIIDTSEASAQPFAYEGENDLLVFNGEIFNYRELAKDLPALKTSGDVEVLYRLLKKKGEACLHQLNGFFAFAYLGKNGSALLARDRFGEKPLYYTVKDNRLYFASELKALLALTGPKELNADQLYVYFRLSYCAGPQTIFKDIYRLLPGQLLRFDKGKTVTKQWYEAKKDAGTTGDLFSLLDDAVKIRLRADVPVGSFLSGGLDSSIITSLAARHMKLPAFTVGFSDDPYLDETRYASAVAKHLGIPHHVFPLSEGDFLDSLTPFLTSIDEPFADSSAFNVFVLSLRTKQFVKVALSGDGADELFKGYRKHAALQLSQQKLLSAVARFAGPLLKMFPASRSGNFPDKIRQAEKFARLCRLPYNERIRFAASIAQHDDIGRLLCVHPSDRYFRRLFEDSGHMRGFAADERFDMAHVLADDMLVKGDRFSMCHGLEIRNPFLDPGVAGYALSLPQHAKIRGNKKKIALRNTFGHLLPGSILKRPKRGFEVPIERWLKTVLWQQLDGHWLNEEQIRHEGIISVEEVRRLKGQLHSARPEDSPARLWSLLVFRQWTDNFANHIRRADGRPVLL